MKNFKRAAMLGAKTIGLSKEEIIETMETLSDLQKNYIKSQLLEINYSKYKWVNEIQTLIKRDIRVYIYNK